MSQSVELGSMMSGMLKLLSGGDAPMKQAARMIGREGMVKAGRFTLRCVQKHVPVFRGGIFSPFQVPTSRQRYGFRAGELRESIYFTNAKRGFSWSRGKLKYLVGMPHGSPGKSTPGWYAHFVEFGHRRRNWIVVNDRTGWTWPKKTEGRGKGVKQLVFKRVPPKPFMAPGIAAASGAVPGIMLSAMRKQLGIEFLKLKLR